MIFIFHTLGATLCMLITAFLWGATNPLLKKYSKGFEKISQKNTFSQIIAEIKFLGSNKKYLLFLLLNQCGSLFFYLTLSQTNLSIAVPVVNFGSLVFTGLVGHLLGEEALSKGSFFGMSLVTLGATLCICSQV